MLKILNVAVLLYVIALFLIGFDPVLPGLFAMIAALAVLVGGFVLPIVAAIARDLSKP